MQSAHKGIHTLVLQFLGSYPTSLAMTSGPISGTPSGQLFSRSSHPSTPALRDIQEKNLGGVSSGHAIPQLHPENSQVMSPNSPGPVQPLHPAPSTPPLALEVKAPTSSSLASPQLSLTRAATMTHTVSPCSTAQIRGADAGNHPAE